VRNLEPLLPEFVAFAEVELALEESVLSEGADRCGRNSECRQAKALPDPMAEIDMQNSLQTMSFHRRVNADRVCTSRGCKRRAGCSAGLKSRW
jgi:hypothetical protein